MARKLSSKDLFEQEDIFKGVRESAQSTLKTLEGLEGQLKGVAEGLKAAVSSMKLDSSKGLKEFTQLTEQSNDLVKESIQLAKLKAEAEQQERKAEQELLKVQKLKNQEAERQQRAAEKEQRAAEKRIKQQKDQESAYKQIAAATRDLKAESKELGAQLLQMQKAGKQGTAEFDSLKQRFDSVTAEAAKMDQELKELDASVGDFFRNVGNYKSATEGLADAFNKLGDDTGDVSLKFEEVYGEIQPLTSRLGEAEDRLYELTLAGKENTEQYKKLLEEVVKYRKAQIKTDLVVDQSAQTMSQKLGGSLTAVAGGFEIATAGMTLFGVESEGVANAILKIQQVMALTDGIKNIQENINSVKALGSTAVNAVKNMSGAMMGLVGGGIGLAITGLVLLANKLTAKSKEREKIENDIEKNREKQKKLLADELEKVRLINDLSKQKLNTLDKQYNRLIKIAQAQGKVVEAENLDMELKKKKVDQLRANREDTRKQLSDVTKEMEIINKELQTMKRSSMGLAELTTITFGSFGDKNEYRKVTGGRFAKVGGTAYEAAQKEIAKEYGVTSGMTEDQKKLAKAIKLVDNLSAKMELYNEIAKNGTQIQSDLRDSEADVIAYEAQLAKDRSERAKAYNQETKSLLREIEDEQIEQIKDENQREQTQLIVAARRRIEDLKNIKGHATEKAKLQKEIEKKLLYDLEQLDKEYWAKWEQARIDAHNFAVQEQREFWSELEELQEQNQRATMSEEDVEIRDVEDKYFRLRALAEEHGEGMEDIEIWYMNAINDIRLKYQKEAEDNQKTANDKAEQKRLAALQKQLKNEQAVVKATADYFITQSNKKIEQIDKEIAAAEKQADTLRTLAQEGNIDAQQSLAEQQRIIDEANRKKELQQKRQQQIELAQSVYSTYSSKLEAGSKNALAETIRDTTLLQQFINSLPAFEKGTEDTGVNGRGVDGRGGFHAILHPNERVIPKSLNEQIGSLTNEELTRLASDYNNGRLLKHTDEGSSLEFAMMVNELTSIKKAIIDKPETNIELGRITQGAMEIVNRTKKGNTTIYNRYKVK